MKLQRSIGAFGLLFAGISSVIGSGWLFGPLYAAQVAGPAAVVSWILGGILMSIIAFTFAELGSTFPVAGGMIQYAQQSHGALMSFLIGWMVWVSSVTVAPVETLGILQYMANYIPSLMHTVNHAPVLTHTGTLAAAFIMLIMCALNYYGAHFFSRSNSILTIIKLIVPVATIIILLSIHFQPSHFYQKNMGGFAPFGWHGLLAALPLGGIIYSFVGSNTILQLAGETKNPQRNIPFALIGTMFFCTIIYALLQLAFIGSIPTSALLKGWGQLKFVGSNGPFAGIMGALGLGWFVIIIYADAVISPFGTGFVFTASTARVVYGLSNIGFLPRALKKLSKTRVPLRSIILNYIVGSLLFLPFPGWQTLVSFIISCFIISYIIGPISLIALRHREPHLARPFRLPFAYIITIISFYICNLLIFWTGWQTVSRMMLVLLFGLIVFLIRSLQDSKAKLKENWRSAWWIVPYFIIMTIISYLGSFGHGKNILPFGIDFIVIAIMTLFIFYAALPRKEIG